MYPNLKISEITRYTRMFAGLFVFTGNPCPFDQVPCPFNRSQCIYEYQLCDGVIDCFNRSDESLMLCRKDVLKNSAKQKPFIYMCCFTACPQGHIRCFQNPTECFPISSACNGIPDCSDGSDETEICGGPGGIVTNTFQMFKK